jgi:hypothetical protein
MTTDPLITDAGRIARGLWDAVRAASSKPELERFEREALEGLKLLQAHGAEHPEYREPLRPVMEELASVVALARSRLRLLVAADAIRDRTHPVRLELRRRTGWRREQRRAHADQRQSTPTRTSTLRRPRERRGRRVHTAGRAGDDDPEPDHVVRPPHSAAERAALKILVDRKRRRQRHRDRAARRELFAEPRP